MTRSRLAIRRIEIRRMPGFEYKGFPLDDLSPGITVIHGPNASGKTTLAEAVRAALWPQRAPAGAEVRAAFELDEEPWSVDHEGGTSRWMCGTSQEPGPDLPPNDASDRYILCLHDLVAAERPDDSFARQILKESTGGYDVSAAAEALRFKPKPSRRNVHDAKKVNEAADEKNRALEKQKEIRRQEQELQALRTRHEAARASARRAEALQIAIEHAEARHALEQAENRLSCFPGAMQQIRGDEADRLQEIDNGLQEHEHQVEQAEHQIETADHELQALQIPEDGVQVATLDTLEQKASSLMETERDLRANEQETAKRQKDLENAQASLRQIPSEGALEQIDPSAWDEIAAFANEWEQVHAQAHQLDAETERLQVEKTHEPDTLRRGVDALRAWLREAPTQSPRFSRLPLLLTSLAGLAGTLAAAILVHFTFLVPALVLVVALVWGLRSPASSPSGEHAWRQAYQETRLEPPDRWEPQAVRDRLQALEAGLVQAVEQEHRKRRRVEVEQERSRLQKKIDVLQERRRTIENTFGPAPGDDARTLLWVVQRTLDWQEAHDALEQARAAHRDLEQHRTHLLASINSTLQRLGHDGVQDAHEARARVKHLTEQANRQREAHLKLEHAQNDRVRARKDLERLRESRRAVFTKLGLSEGDRRALEDLLARHDDYHKTCQQLQTVQEQTRALLAKLRQHPSHAPDMDTADPHTLQDAHALALEKADELEPLHKQIVEIEKSVHDAKEDTRVQEALQRHNEAMDRLRDDFEQDAHAVIGDLVARHVHEESRDQDRPPVFHRARELLLGFTQGRYRLEFDHDDPPTFKARDTTTQNLHRLEALSSATRLHLLLAVRIAFVEHQEKDIALPLVLDETLANSDDLRAGAVIDAVILLARTGRQVLYLTAQGDEVAKWKTRLTDTGMPHAIRDLAQARDLSNRLELPEQEPIATAQEIPGPDGTSHADYAKILQVPPFDPRAGTGATHLWYLVEDVHLLHRLLCQGITTYGQLEALRTQGVPVARAEDEGPLQAVQRLAAALETYTRTWCIGRGKPVNRYTLQATGAVSPKFIEELTQIARAQNGDAQAVLRAIDAKKVPGFRSNKRDELHIWLEEHGHLDPHPPLDGAEIRVRVLGAAADALQQEIITTKDVDRLLERVTRPPTITATA